MAQAGNAGKFPHVFSNTTWIIDTGVSDHMENDFSQVTNIQPSSQSIITTADGSPSLFTGKVTVTLSSSLTLDTVLIIPSLAYSLLSMCQITLTLSFLVIFWHSFCIFQDILTYKILGYGVRRGNLYYLYLTKTGTKLLGCAHKIGGVEETKSKVWLWYRRLGHLSFGYLRKLQTSLFSVLSDYDFKCDVCELVKSHRISYSPSFNKSSVLFIIIYSDVWGPT